MFDHNKADPDLVYAAMVSFTQALQVEGGSSYVLSYKDEGAFGYDFSFLHNYFPDAECQSLKSGDITTYMISIPHISTEEIREFCLDMEQIQAKAKQSETQRPVHTQVGNVTYLGKPPSQNLERE